MLQLNFVLPQLSLMGGTAARLFDGRNTQKRRQASGKRGLGEWVRSTRHPIYNNMFAECHSHTYKSIFIATVRQWQEFIHDSPRYTKPLLPLYHVIAFANISCIYRVLCVIASIVVTIAVEHCCCCCCFECARSPHVYANYIQRTSGGGIRTEIRNKQKKVGGPPIYFVCKNVCMYVCVWKANYVRWKQNYLSCAWRSTMMGPTVCYVWMATFCLLHRAFDARAAPDTCVCVCECAHTRYGGACISPCPCVHSTCN